MKLPSGRVVPVRVARLWRAGEKEFYAAEPIRRFPFDRDLWLVNRAFAVAPSTFVGLSGAFSKQCNLALRRILVRTPAKVRRVTVAFVFTTVEGGRDVPVYGVSMCSPSEKFYSRKVGALGALSRALRDIAPQDSAALRDEARLEYARLSGLHDGQTVNGGVLP